MAFSSHLLLRCTRLSAESADYRFQRFQQVGGERLIPIYRNGKAGVGMANISMKALLEAGVHFGHQTSRWNPKMAKYIFSSRNKIHIIDLSKTVKELRRALNFLRDIAAEGKEILFVGTTKQAQESIVESALRCHCPYVSERWLGGMLTNFETIQKSIARLKEIERMKTERILDLLPKREGARLEKTRLRLEKSLSGVKEMNSLPGALFIIDPMSERTAVYEAKKMEIPTVAVCDTNSDPDLIDVPIPGNDDAVRSIKLFCSYVADAIIEGNEIFAKKTETIRTENLPKEENLTAPETVSLPDESNSFSESPEKFSGEQNERLTSAPEETIEEVPVPKP